MFESQAPKPETVPAQPANLPVADVSYVTLAGLIGVSVDTLYSWVRAGKIPQPVYFGNLARWSPDQVKKIISEGTQAAGTYPPVNSPRAKQLQKRPANAHKSVGGYLGKKSAREPVKPHVKPRSKRKERE